MASDRLPVVCPGCKEARMVSAGWADVMLRRDGLLCRSCAATRGRASTAGGEWAHSNRRKRLPCVDCGTMIFRSPSDREKAKGVQCGACRKRNRRANACHAFGPLSLSLAKKEVSR